MPEKAQSGKAAVHLIYGPDEFEVSRAARELVDKLCPPANQAFGLEIIDGRVSLVDEAIKAINRCIDGLLTVGLLGGEKVVWLRDANFLGSGVLAESASVKERVADLAAKIKAGIPAGQTLVISADKVDGRSAFLKACQGAGEIRKFEVPESSYAAERQAVQKAEEMARQFRLSFSEDAMDLFMELSGTNTRQIAQEMEKLSLYLGGRKDVRLDDVRAIVSPSRERAGWDLADAVARRDLPQSLRLVRQLLFQGENVIGLITFLDNRFRELMVFRDLLDRKWLTISSSGPKTYANFKAGPDVDAKLSQLAKDPRVGHPFRISLLAEQARKFGPKELARIHGLIVQARENMVSDAMPKNLLLEFLIIRILGPGQDKAMERARAG